MLQNNPLAKGFMAFSEKELKSNRKGQFTAEQLEMVRAIGVSSRGMSKTIALGFFIFFVLLFAGIYFFNPEVKAQIQPHLFLWTTIALGLPAASLLVAYFMGDKMTRNFMDVQTVSIVQGELGKSHWDGEDGRTYQLEVEGVKFFVVQEFYDQLKTSEKYAFYYVPAVNYNLILSWEKI